jgi:dTDP-glucose 4,6-dehydratase
MAILVTGGAGFIGTNFVLDWIREEYEQVINLDKLTYAGNVGNFRSLDPDAPHVFVQGDICDSETVAQLLYVHKPRAIVHLAAESHVDRSIHGPGEFIDTNVTGTFRLLDEARKYWDTLTAGEKSGFRFIHVSTDEVYGSLGPSDAGFSESTAYAPNSPYSASKAASDHLARAWFHTYGMPVITTNCSNNYGPYQFPEKLIPLMLLNGLKGESLPIYGDGRNVRDWLYVGDHCAALRRVIADGRPGETYNIGGNSEMANLDVVNTLCQLLDRLHADSPVTPHSELISFVADRPGHDQRYAVNASKIAEELGWKPQESFDSGLERTVRWYLDNPAWIEDVSSGKYREWIDENYGQRVAAEPVAAQ